LLYKGLKEERVEALMSNISNQKYTLKDINWLFPTIDYDEGIGSCPYCGITGASLGISHNDRPL
jgi:hypothetical protein